MKIRFSNVGRDKKTWEDEIPLDSEGYLAERQMYASVKRQSALMSADIDFSDSGEIYAGGRNVGKWEIVEEKGATT